MYKQVIVIRNDLGMSKGKIAVQACHASICAYKKARKSVAKMWESNGQKKVVVKIGSKKAILNLSNKVRRAKIPSFLVKDAGLTELKPGTITALGIGPDNENKIDKITANLKLLD